MARHVVLRAAELPEGESRIVTVRGREIAVFNLGGEFFALVNRCPWRRACPSRWRRSMWWSRCDAWIMTRRPG